MGNHYHLLVETPLANLDRICGILMVCIPQQHNRLKRTDGPLFRGRYKAVLIDESAHLLQVSRYIHRNPAEIKGATAVALDTYVWSSYLAYINKEKAPYWLAREMTLRLIGGRSPYQRHRHFVLSGNDAVTREFYGGDCVTGIFGDRSFRQSVYDEQEMFEVAANLPKLVKQPLEMERIVEVVAQAFNVDKATVLARQSGQRYSNTPRKVAMYCAQKHGDHKQKEIAKYFNLNNPGSVSSAIRSICPALEAGALKKTYAVIQRDLNIVKLTWPPYSSIES